VVGRIVAEDARRQRRVVVEYEWKLEHPESRTSGLRPALAQPFARGVQEKPGGVACTGSRLEHEDVAEALVPMAVVPAVEHGDRADHDVASRARYERLKRPAFGEGAGAGEQWHLERRQRGPPRRPIGVDRVLEQDELGESVRAPRPLDGDGHVRAALRAAW